MHYSTPYNIKEDEKNLRLGFSHLFFIPPVNIIDFQRHLSHNKIWLYQITDSQHCRHIFQEYFLHILQEMLSNPNYFCNFASPIKVAGCSSVRFRVLVWGASGRKFESCHPDNGTDYLSQTISVLFYTLIIIHRIAMSLIRVLLSIIFPPLAVFDRGCGSILIVLILTLCGWVPGIIAALVILNKR